MREIRLRGWWWKIPLLLAIVVPVGWSAYGLAVHEPAHPRERTAIELPDPPAEAPTVRPPTVLDPKLPPGPPPDDPGGGEPSTTTTTTTTDDDDDGGGGGQDVFPAPDPARDDDDDDDGDDWDDDGDDGDDDDGDDD